LIKLIKYYQEDVENESGAILFAKYKLWRRCLKIFTEKPINVLYAMSFPGKEMYLNSFTSFDSIKRTYVFKPQTESKLIDKILLENNVNEKIIS